MEPKYQEKLRQLGLNISYYRKYRRMTQLELAEKANISSCYVSQIERGSSRKAVSLPVLIALADALEIEVADLFDFREVKR